MDESLPRRCMLRSRTDFERLFGHGRSRQGKYVVINYLPWTGQSEGDEFRAAFVCGRRIGHAVIRNRQKRRMREIVRRHKDVCAGLEFIVVAKHAILQASYEKLQADLVGVLSQIQQKVRL